MDFSFYVEDLFLNAVFVHLLFVNVSRLIENLKVSLIIEI